MKNVYRETHMILNKFYEYVYIYIEIMDALANNANDFQKKEYDFTMFSP